MMESFEKRQRSQKNQIRPLQEGNEALSRQNVAQLGRDDDDDDDDRLDGDDGQR